MSGVLLAVVFLAVMYGLYLFDEWLPKLINNPDSGCCPGFALGYCRPCS